VYTGKTFFEYISMADSEKVHSQTLGWIFSNNCNALNKSDKESIIKKIIYCQEEIEIEDVFVEIDDIDILIKCKNRLIIIENKIKISEHDNQLEKYEIDANEKAKELNISPKNLSFIYLTLDKEESNKKPWIDISYKDLIKEFESVSLKDNKDSVILNQYLTTLNRIITTIDCCINDNELRKWCFKNTGLKKYNLLDKRSNNTLFNEIINDEIRDKALYIVENGLIRFIQKIYYKRTLESIEKNFLENNFSKGTFGASSSNGEGLIQLHFKDPYFIYNNIRFLIGYQIQNQTIKINISHENYHESKKSQLPSNFKELLDKIKVNLNFNGKVSIGTSKAYGSITKKMSFDFSEKMSPNQLASFIKEDIKNSKYREIISKIISETLIS
jgi:hypothetical protein